MWKLNVAHTFFMSETKFKEAMRYYEPAVEKYQDNILQCSVGTAPPPRLSVGPF